MPINKLLVVTFTKAATAELASRIRAHIGETLGFLTGIYGREDVDPLVVRQVDIWRGGTRLRRRGRRAPSQFARAL